MGRTDMASGRKRWRRNLEIWTWALLLLLSSAASAAASDMRMLASSLFATNRISASDLQNRQSLERTIQLAAFQQFDRHKTARLYNVSVVSSQISSGSIVQAIRLRVGSFRRYGVDINEFSIPRGCRLNSNPERILLVYASLINNSLFNSLPDHQLASSVVSIFGYDASNLSSTQPADKLILSTTSTPISIRIPSSQPLSSSLSCASFDDNSTAVNYSALVQNACSFTHLGAFALVSNASTPIVPPPTTSPKSSNTWKIVVGSVVGGLALLALLTLLVLALYKHTRNAKFATMEYQAGQGETLQTTSIRNSRAPAAGTTRTQPALENEYAI